LGRSDCAVVAAASINEEAGDPVLPRIRPLPMLADPKTVAAALLSIAMAAA
jgi:hypothetical protein